MKFFFLLLTTSAFALEEQPWFGNICELDAKATYTYSFFKKVNHGVPQLKKTWHDNLLTLNLGTTLPENWNWEFELQGDATTRRSFNYSSFAAQGRYLILNDVEGDPISLSFGGTLRQVAGQSLHQLSTPYHARFDAELHAAIGKEWCNPPNWTTRLYAFGAVGQGNQGATWYRSDFFYMGNYCDKVQWRLFLLGYFGMGHHERVNTKHFQSWGKIAHRSLDLGAGLRFLFYPWGSFRFDYARRIFARSYPENVNFFIFSYELPFSLI